MKRYFIYIVLIGILSLQLDAQDQGSTQSVNDKIEARKIALITQRLELTPEQAAKFWPIYRELSLKQKDIRQDFRLQRQNFDPKNASEEEMKKMIDLGLKVKERQLNLEREYAERMRQVITNRQMVNLRRAEEEFRQRLMERIQRQRQNAQQQRQRSNNARNKRRNN